MKFLDWLSMEGRRWFGPEEPAEPRRMQVRNATRATLLGTSVVVADNGTSRRVGLLEHTELALGEGLWIVPCESVHTIGMKFALDLVYLDRRFRVRKVCSNVGPWRMSLCLSASSILELPVGVIQETGTRRGDLLELTPVESSNHPD